MGLAKKGSRKIRVENSEFRWVVSPDSGFMVIVIETAKDPGQRLFIQIGYNDTRSASGYCVQTQKITPALVRQIILKAQAIGWTPSKRGKELYLKLEKGDLLTMATIRTVLQRRAH
jgi:hypothetical protein